jgi:hypothetical protein
MRFLLAVFVTQWLASAFFYFYAERPLQGMPHVSFLESAVDVGIQPCGSKWRGSAALRNDGDVPVRLVRLEKSCRCTQASLQAGVILNPGDTVSIDLIVEVGGKGGVRSGIELLVEFAAVESPLNGWARFRLSYSSQCEDVGSMPAPIPDPAFAK